ncbi:cilia- and flagella-associated protein 52 [Anabrus simplex]|uniref:cilia- and flagella-associated protein 52 n=1 Tax=Anabrus simplex TaxID=316456 RepID=UPI0035A26445
MENCETADVKDLEVLSIIGFDGTAVNGLKLHPDGVHILYPLGNKVGIQNWKTKNQQFLSGHTNVISAVDISPCGKYVASGQVNYMGFKACVILWDFEKRKFLAKHEIHKVRVQSVIFTCDSSYVVSLGGRDDCNVVVWDVQGSEAVCGSLASTSTSGDALVLCGTTRRGLCFLSGGENTLRVWKINPDKRNVTTLDVKFGMIKRHITCIVVDERDEFAYGGSTTGDIIKARLNYDYDPKILDPLMNPVLIGCYAKFPIKKAENGDPTVRYSKGVTALALLTEPLQTKILVAAGDGTVEMVKERSSNPKEPEGRLRMPSIPHLDVLKTAKLDDGITSLNIMGKNILVGTINCEIYTINLDTFHVMLHITCHTHSIFDIAFPHDFGEVFATSSKHDIRVWNISTSQELLRISVPNFTCSSVVFAHDGRSIVSGWNDGIIRAFTPQTGRLIYSILSAHSKGVSVLRMTSDDKMIVSGGVEGQIRIWDIKPTCQTLTKILKEHKAPITSIALSRSDTEAVSACTDGTCIIWDLTRQVRSQVLFANTQFMSACFFPTGVQILTTGTDRKIGYWEVYDGSLIRELEGSNCAALNTLDISADGHMFVTGGCDQYVKLWDYKDGVTTHIGTAHAAIVTAVQFSSDGRYIISVSADGAIIRWKCPQREPEIEADAQSVTESFSSSRSSCSIREYEWRKAVRQKQGEKEGSVHLSRQESAKSKASDQEREASTAESGTDEPVSRESIRSLASSMSSRGSVRSQIESPASAPKDLVLTPTGKDGSKSVASSQKGASPSPNINESPKSHKSSSKSSIRSDARGGKGDGLCICPGSLPKRQNSSQIRSSKK